jgi:cobalt-zinc-cadmium efflux system outer membrane protein
MRVTLIATALTLTLSAQAAEPTDPERLVAEALATHPALTALDDGIHALEAMAGVAGAWMDPTAAVELSNLPLEGMSLGAHPMAGLQLKLQQTLPISGTPGAREALAEARVEDAGLARAQRAEQLAMELRTAFWRLAAVRQDQVLTERHIALLDELLAVVRARYEAGAAPQSALLELELRRARLADALEDRDRDAAHLLASLNQALQRPASTALVTPAQTPMAEATGDTSTWLRQARSTNPSLEALSSMARTARLEAELARVDGRPDPTLWAGYRLRTVETDMDPGTDLVSLGVSLPIPVASGRVAGGTQAAAEHRARALEAQHRAVEDQIEAQLTAAEASWLRASSLLHRTEDELIPSAQRTLEAVLTDYRVGRAEFDALVRAEIELLELERAAVAAAATTQLQRAVVLALMGEGVPEDAP